MTLQHAFDRVLPCTCLQRNCKRRYLKVFDPNEGCFESIALCNDAIRLIYQENEHKEAYYSKNISIIYEEIIIDAYYELGIKCNPCFNYIMFGGFNFVVCERPYVFLTLDLRNAVDFYLSAGNTVLGVNNIQFRFLSTIRKELREFSKKVTGKQAAANEKKIMAQIKQLNKSTKYCYSDIDEMKSNCEMMELLLMLYNYLRQPNEKF